MVQPVTQHLDLSLAQLSVAQYHAMRDAGILDEDDAVELLEGLLVRKMTKLPPHSVATTLVKDALARVIPSVFHLRAQEPVTTTDSEPEPDVAVVRGSPRDYLARHPSSSEVALIVEVADDSLKRDRGTKLRLYARAGIPEYWIVNLRARIVEVYRDPRSDEYGTREDFSPGSSVVLAAGDTTVTVEVDALLP